MLIALFYYPKRLVDANLKFGNCYLNSYCLNSSLPSDCWKEELRTPSPLLDMYNSTFLGSIRNPGIYVEYNCTI